MSSRVENVIVISNYAGIGGGASQIAILTGRVLLKEGYNVVFFAGYGEGGEVFDGMRLVVVGDKPFLGMASKIRGALEGIHSRRVYEALCSLLADYDSSDTVIHIHGWTHGLSSSIFDAIADCGFRSVCTLHEYFLKCPNGGFFDYGRQEICMRKACSPACLVHNCDKRNYVQKLYRVARLKRQNRAIKRAAPKPCYLSPFTYGWLKGNVLDDGRPTYLPNPISVEGECSPSRLEDRNGYLFIGRMDSEKNPRLFCEALTRLGLPGTLCGDGPLLAELKRDFPNLDFRGWCDKGEIAKYARANKALILASYCLEASPLVCLEAMFAAAIPSVVPDTCGATAYIEDGVNGLWFENGSVDSLCDALRKLEDPEFYGEICANLERVMPGLREDRSFEVYAKRLADIYEGLYE